MLACLPASADPAFRLLSRTQMNTGLQKWETTQKMRSASCPTPAELDAYAKKVANNPLTIQIFPNSVKVPQRKHIRRTVNGLDTSSSSQRHSPYPPQVSSSRGLLAVLRVPLKGVIKESDGSRSRHLHKAIMNPHSGPYATPSTLNLPQPPPHLQGPPQPQPPVQKPGMVHPQALQQSMTHAMTLQPPHDLQHAQALQQRSVSHAQALQQQQRQHSLAAQQQRAAPRQQSLPHTPGLQQQQPQPCPPVLPSQHLSHLHTLKHQPPPPPPQALLSQPGPTQDLRLLSDGTPLPSLQHPQAVGAGPNSLQPHPQAVGAGPNSLQPHPQAVGAGPSSLQPHPQAMGAGPNSLQQHPQAVGAGPSSLQQQQQPPGAFGPRKLSDADAPPNVTVSTSTIPLSMAASLHQTRPSDLSSIVHQINQLCQARAGMGATSVCEGQIANPSPISRNLLINASSRVSSHHPHACLMLGPPDKAQTPGPALHPQPSLSAPNSVAAFHSDTEKVHLQQQQQQQLQQHLHQQKQQQLQHLQLQQQQQQQQQQQRSWAQHQLAHMQQPPEGAHPCKNPRMEPPAECSFPSRNLSYPHKLPSATQSFPLKHGPEKLRSSSPVSCPGGSMPYVNGHFLQPPWASSASSSNGSALQDLPAPFQAAQASAERIPGAKYRPGKEAAPAPHKLLQNVDFLGGDFQIPNFQEQNIDVMEKMHRSAMAQVQEPNSGGGGGPVHIHHPGYR